MKNAIAALALVSCVASFAWGAEANLRVRLSWGHGAGQSSSYYIKPLSASDGLRVGSPSAVGLEAQETERDGVWQTRAGAGDVDGVEFTLTYDDKPRERLQRMQVIWTDLLSASDADSARRLGRDAAMIPKSPKLTVAMNQEGTLGFSVTLDQLLTEKAIYVPELHAYIAAGDQLISFEQHQSSLSARKGMRVLDRLAKDKEATLDEYLSLWEDMGDPAYTNPQPRGPGHIIGVTWDSAIAKFGIDRGAGVWPDYGNPDKFRFWFGFADTQQGITRHWKGQHLKDGLPVITTILERDGIRYEVEQFAYPLNGVPSTRRGDLKMVLFQKVRLTELSGRTRAVPVSMAHTRQVRPHFDATFEMERSGDAALFREAGFKRVLFSIQGVKEDPVWTGSEDYQKQQKRLDAVVFQSLPARGTAEFIVKLPSPILEPADVEQLVKLDYTAAREGTLKYWASYIERGAQFEVPEKKVNDLFRANLWHALRLPRRHGSGENVRIDLPYSNFAYDQTGTPWPVNQAVYVDYMLYDLRGYHEISTEELVAQYRNNQESNGHVSGFANWVVYTPSMLYVVAKNYMLSRDKKAFEQLLPHSLKAMDWCLEEMRRAQSVSGQARGLVAGPLNDLTGDGVWAFNQAYMYAGLDLFGKALAAYGHKRSQEPQDAAARLRRAIELAFSAASVQSPVVQLRDGTWIPYVPAEALSPRRLLDTWYPTDVDTGAVHMVRLNAIDPKGRLADRLLHDHEDNLFYKGWGIANEPVYNQHATAYLLRDEVPAAIRVFYSYMASAFSHSALEPVEHRYTHGQYFGPPSTDGAWFDLYRHMLIREREDGALLLGQATPRAWMENGKQVRVSRAPTYYGPLTMTLSSEAASGRLRAEVELASRERPRNLLIRLRHPEGKQMQKVTVNGLEWTNIDRQADWIQIPDPGESRYTVVATY